MLDSLKQAAGSLLAMLEPYQAWILWGSGVSLFVALAGMLCLPWFITRLPPDYFCQPDRRSRDSLQTSAAGHLFLSLVKNAAGFLLVILGMIMLVTPGQGVLTILAGLFLMQFPGKYRLERWLVGRPGVLPAMNWLRAKRAKPPFEAPPKQQ